MEARWLYNRAFFKSITMINKYIYLVTMALNIVFIGYSQEKDDRYKKIDSLFYSHMANPSVKNAFFRMESPKNDLEWSVQEGRFKNGTDVNSNTSFLITSVTKTFTATLIMILQEEGKLSVSDPIQKYLSEDILDQLHLYKGKNYTSQIRISHLLQHTSGLPDYFEDSPNEGPNFMETLFLQPNRIWHPKEIISFSKSKLHPHFAPGEGYQYSDTNYVLLGLIVEELQGKAYHQVLHEKLFLPLNMAHTYMPLLSKAVDSEIGIPAETFVGEQEISSFKSLSADWAGGGMASTSEDLLRFMKALLNGKIISFESLAQMQNWTLESYGLTYGFGLRRFELDQLFPDLKGISIVGHSGTTGSFMYYCKEFDLYIAGTFNQTNYKKEHVLFLAEVLGHLQSLNY